MTSVVAQAISIQRELLDNLHQQCALSRHVESWESLEEAVRRAKILGTLDHEQELSISIVARNVSIIAGAVTSVDCEMLGQIDNLSRTFKAILHTDNPGEQSQDPSSAVTTDMQGMALKGDVARTKQL